MSLLTMLVAFRHLVHLMYNLVSRGYYVMPLNEDLDFSSASVDVQMAFLGSPEKVFLRTGKKLYKWTDHGLFGPWGITPWWSYVEQTRLPSGFIAEGFRTSEERARRLGVTHRQYQKVRSAVSEKFNNELGNLLVIQLLDDIWGFAGKTSGQPEFKDPGLARVFLIGGKGQLWIPNLTLTHIRQVSAVG